MTIRVRKITDRELWLQWRRENINASEGGAVLGVDSYRTPLELFHEKQGNLVTEETNAMRRGRWLEPAVLKAVMETRPDWEVTPQVQYYDDPELRVGCTPDAFLSERKSKRRGVLQAKTVNEFAFREWAAGGELAAPLSYQIQTVIESVQTLRADFAVLGVLVVGARSVELQILPVPVHMGAWEAFLAGSKKFWADFAKGVAPPVTAPDADLIKRLYPIEQAGSIIDLARDNEMGAWVARERQLAEILSAARAANKPAEKEREGLLTLIKGKIGENETAILPGGYQATYKTVAEHPVKAFRQLRISTLSASKEYILTGKKR